MTTTQLVGVLTLVGTLLVAGITLGRNMQQIDELLRRVEKLENVDRFLHGDTSYVKP